MKVFLGKVWRKKMFGSIGIATLLIISIFYLWGLFVKQDGILEFNKTDTLFLFLLAIMGIFICLIVVYLVISRNREIKDKNEIREMLVNILTAINEHDVNDILFQKTTQDMMIKLHMKIIDNKGGVMDEESNTDESETKEFHTI